MTKQMMFYIYELFLLWMQLKKFINACLLSPHSLFSTQSTEEIVQLFESYRNLSEILKEKSGTIGQTLVVILSLVFYLQKRINI